MINTYLEINMDISTTKDVLILIYYERVIDKIYINDVVFNFDNEWLSVSQNWRNDNLELLREKVRTGLTRQQNHIGG